MSKNEVTIEDALQLAKQRINEKKLENAQKIYGAVLEAVPENREAKLGLIAVSDAIICDYYPPLEINNIDEFTQLVISPNPQKLVQHLSQKYGKNIGSSFVQNLFGVAFTKMGNLESGIFHFQKAFELNTSETGIFTNLCYALYENKQFELGFSIINQYRHLNHLKFDYHFFNILYSSELGTYTETETSVSILKYEFEDNPKSWLAIGTQEFKLKCYSKAVEAFEAYFNLGGNEAEAHNNIGVCFSKLGFFKKAQSHFNKAIELSPDNPDFHYSLSFVELTLGNLSAGFAEFEWRLKKPNNYFVHPDSSKIWDGHQDLSGKHILVYHEQGLGDTLQFLRYVIPLYALGANVSLCVQPQFHSLLKHQSLPVKLVSEEASGYKFDYSISLMSLGHRFGPEIPDEILIRSKPQVSELWQQRLLEKARDRTKIKIGVCWKGNPLHENDANRSMNFSDLEPLFDLPFQFVSLQKDITDNERQSLIEKQIIDVSSMITDFDDTAGIIDNLDAVVTVDTSVAHLALSMRKSTLLMISKASDWRWGTGKEEASWYSSAMMFRQEKLGEWRAPVEEVGLFIQSLEVSY